MLYKRVLPTPESGEGPRATVREKIENSIGVQISRSASREKTASAEKGTILGPVNSPLHQYRVRVQRQKRQFTTICSRNWFIIPLAGSSVPQIPKGINQRPPLSPRLRLRLRLRLGLKLRLRLRLRRPRAKKVDPQSPFKWKIIHLDPLHIKVTEVHVESMLHIIFHPPTVDVVEKTCGGMPFQVGIILKLNIPRRLGTGNRLAGAFVGAISPFSTPFMLVHPLHHLPIVLNLRTLRRVMQWGLTSVMELHKGVQTFDRYVLLHPIVVHPVNGVRELVNDPSGSLPYSTELFLFFLSVLDQYPVDGNENRGRVFP